MADSTSADRRREAPPAAPPFTGPARPAVATARLPLGATGGGPQPPFMARRVEPSTEGVAPAPLAAAVVPDESPDVSPSVPASAPVPMPESPVAEAPDAAGTERDAGTHSRGRGDTPAWLDAATAAVVDGAGGDGEDAARGPEWAADPVSSVAGSSSPDEGDAPVRPFTPLDLTDGVDLPAWLDESGIRAGTATASAERVASVLDALAARLRRGELAVAADARPSTDAAALALVLSAVLAGEQ